MCIPWYYLHRMILNPFAKDILKFDTFYDLYCYYSFTSSHSTLPPTSPPPPKKRKTVLAYKFWLSLARPSNILGVFYLMVDLTIYLLFFVIEVKHIAVFYSMRKRNCEKGMRRITIKIILLEHIIYTDMQKSYFQFRFYLHLDSSLLSQCPPAI